MGRARCEFLPDGYHRSHIVRLCMKSRWPAQCDAHIDINITYDLLVDIFLCTEEKFRAWKFVVALSLLNSMLTFALLQLDNYSGPELGDLCRKYSITNPDTGNEVSEPQQFNLMFASSIGPTGQHPGSDLSFFLLRR